MYKRYRFAQPTQRDARPVNPVLTSLSIGFRNENFLWDQISPPFEVSEKTGIFFLYDRDFWFRRQEGAERAPTSPYLRTGYELSTASFNNIEIGFEKELGDPIRASSQTPEDLQIIDTRFLTNLIQLELEKRVQLAHFITGVWGTSNTLTGTNQWSDFANSDPIADMDTAKRTILRNTGAQAMMGFVGLLGWEQLKEHPLILEKYKHTQTGIMTEELVAKALGIDRITVGNSVENTAFEGAAYVGADIWTDNFLLKVDQEPSIDTGTPSVTFMWNEKGNIPWAMEDYRDETIRSDITRVFTHLDPQITSAQHGYLFLDLVA